LNNSNPDKFSSETSGISHYTTLLIIPYLLTILSFNSWINSSEHYLYNNETNLTVYSDNKSGRSDELSFSAAIRIFNSLSGILNLFGLYSSIFHKIPPF
jgi:hypothetical protein